MQDVFIVRICQFNTIKKDLLFSAQFSSFIDDGKVLTVHGVAVGRYPFEVQVSIFYPPS